MSKIEDYKQIIHHFYTQSPSPETVRLIDSLKDDPIFQAAWQEVWMEARVGDENDYYNSHSDAMYDRIRRDTRVKFRPEQLISQNNIPKNALKRISVAAMCLICGVAAWLYWSSTTRDHTSLLSNTEQIIHHPITPGHDRATIILDDGRQIDLSSISGDSVLDVGNFSIVKTKAGHISYQIKPSLKSSTRLVYNTIVTPRGGEYRLKLPDGTDVWLNASTTFRYPVLFDAGHRVVHLKGEAYFDVAKHEVGGQPVPFTVHIGQQRLEVLGTQFNVNSYDDQVKTTLIEGKVRLDYPDTNIKSKFLKPNDQATFDQTKQHYSQHQVDPWYVVAWKDGNFAFEHASLYVVMQDIGRWYDVDIQYHGNFEDVYFSGSISRYSDINKLLQTIAFAGGFSFKLKEREVHIMK